MKVLKYTAAAALLVPAFAGTAAAQGPTQSVSYEVQAINQISLTGSPSLVISTATAGSAPTSASAGASYAITTNGENKKITAQIDSDMPASVTLTVNLAAPSVGSSSNAVVLSTTPVDAVTGITRVSESGLSVGYQLSATVAAGVVQAGSRTVTYTITDGA